MRREMEVLFIFLSGDYLLFLLVRSIFSVFVGYKCFGLDCGWGWEVVVGESCYIFDLWGWGFCF